MPSPLASPSFNNRASQIGTKIFAADSPLPPPGTREAGLQAVKKSSERNFVPFFRRPTRLRLRKSALDNGGAGGAAAAD